jgi:hypothetical protein
MTNLMHGKRDGPTPLWNRNKKKRPQRLKAYSEVGKQLDCHHMERQPGASGACGCDMASALNSEGWATVSTVTVQGIISLDSPPLFSQYSVHSARGSGMIMSVKSCC